MRYIIAKIGIYLCSDRIFDHKTARKIIGICQMGLWFMLCIIALQAIITGCNSATSQNGDAGITSERSADEVAPALSFPKGFWWGTAIAGFQGDMGCPSEPPEQCEDRQSDWYQWATDPDIIAKNSKDDKGNQTIFASGDPISWGPGQWELYAADHKLMTEKLFANSYRMSIEWSRIFPKSTEGIEGYEALKKIANTAAIQRYHDMLNSLRRNKIEPFVTLNHYSLPLWIHDGVACHRSFEQCANKGWAQPQKLLPELTKYAAFVAQEFGSKVDYWITLNEPFAIIIPGYLMQTPDRVNPPGLSLRFAEARITLNAMIEAHALMYDAIKKHDTVDANGDGEKTSIGIAYNFAPVYPANPDRANDVKGAENVSYLLNEVFINAIVNGKLDAQLDGNIQDRPDLKRLDFIGVNYYMKTTVVGYKETSLPDLSPLFTVDPFNMKVEPRFPIGLYDILMLVKKYQKPIIITENGYDMHVPPQAKDGAKADDTDMPAYLVNHLYQLHRAIADGADVRGYLYWSFIDNYEWNHGLNMRFGMFAYNPKDPLKTRIERSAVPIFKQIASLNAIPHNLIIQYLNQ